jgi:hypothetical protein
VKFLPLQAYRKDADGARSDPQWGFASERQDAEANIPVIQSCPLLAAPKNGGSFSVGPSWTSWSLGGPSDYDNTFFLNRADRSDFPLAPSADIFPGEIRQARPPRRGYGILYARPTRPLLIKESFDAGMQFGSQWQMAAHHVPNSLLHKERVGR